MVHEYSHGPFLGSLIPATVEHLLPQGHLLYAYHTRQYEYNLVIPSTSSVSISDKCFQRQRDIVPRRKYGDM